ncbi:uncharacterized protein I206_103271 [Kwoniella pini CBS 10737]|uniref:Nudix hydrolase domain-containing protein n=1 Tax=Kwoniella pini CBS 10737 TaxID=1296096 RepID=A0A1B9IAD2_9TREE|nr:uncharacterized protein I206_01723 [Kwoniella pini CBS 10737]OCF52433.1 hypothetical protein I206_01723 [Kwoniella pini CBS 10737]
MNFKYPSFKIHQSVTRFCLPLSRFSKLPSNQNKTLYIGSIITKSIKNSTTESIKILIVKRQLLNENENENSFKWEIPNGKVKYGIDQTLIESIIRIIKDKIGLIVISIKKEIDSFEYQIDNNQKTYKQYNFITEISINDNHSDEEEVLLNSKEYQAYKWITKEEVLNLDMTDTMKSVLVNGFKSIEQIAQQTE